MSVRRAMVEQGVCRALSERPPSAHRAISLSGRSEAPRWLDGRSVAARRAPGRHLARPLLAELSWGLVGISGVVWFCKILTLLVFWGLQISQKLYELPYNRCWIYRESNQLVNITKMSTDKGLWGFK